MGVGIDRTHDMADAVLEPIGANRQDIFPLPVAHLAQRQTTDMLISGTSLLNSFRRTTRAQNRNTGRRVPILVVLNSVSYSSIGESLLLVTLDDGSAITKELKEIVACFGADADEDMFVPGIAEAHDECFIMMEDSGVTGAKRKR